MISVIVTTFNSKEFVDRCLSSIFKENFSDLEVVAVDNGSRDGTADFIKENYPQANLIKNKKNLGACRARNQGIEISHGEWILILDCDLVLEDDFFRRTSSIIKNADFNLGMFQPKILQNDKKTIFSCGLYLSWPRRFYDIGRNKPDRQNYNFPRQIFGASSACAFYRRKMLEDIKEDSGYFDERFFFLVEDVDLSWRAGNKGWKAVLFPDLRCYHAGGSSGFSRKLRQFLCFRNRFQSIIKNEGIGRYLIKGLPVLFYDIPRIAFLALTNRYFYPRTRKPRL